MKDKSATICHEHQVTKEWRLTTFEYLEDGISVSIPDVYAWVCPKDGEASFTPEPVDELITTVRSLVETAQRARERKSKLRQYIVSVG